jgi:acyl-CoA synthetase (AMP-forming)/AMP-acid ligase II
VVQAGSRFEEAALREFCEERLSGYKVPRRFQSVDALPTNSAGKVQKYLLREAAEKV